MDFLDQIKRKHVNEEIAGSQIKRYKQLIEAAKIVNSTLDLGKLLNIIAETALRNIDADRGTLYLIDEARKELWSKVLNDPSLNEIRLPLGKGIAGHVAVTGHVLNIVDAHSDPRFNPEYDRKTGYQTKTILCMPLRNKDGKIIGVFQLLNRRNGTFTDDDVSFIDALSVHATIAIENARLYEQERQKIAMEKEFIAAREVQMSLIPKHLPKMDNFAFAACTIPAREVGGDYYDFIRLNDQRCELVIADVAGKGLSAALLAAMGKGVFYSQAVQYLSPVAHLKGCNHILKHQFPKNSFITMLVAIVDSKTMTITFANAGHCYPLLYKSNLKTAELLTTKGMAMTLADDLLCNEYSIHMQPNDCLILYSDGITEAENITKAFFDIDRLQTLVARIGHHTAETVLQLILDEIREFSKGNDQSDDITLIVVKATNKPD
ncbi:MAG: SpoIIE family protein phosphatase [Ignavibacteriae bacterium]|nr:SpoIIE family protein phosphatase [Ignavibacteriota bacterium]